MVYCKYIKHNKESATYQYGGSVNNLTGVIVFNFKKDYFEIIQKPEGNDIVFMKHIESLYEKYKNNFREGIFPDKMAWITH